MGLARESSKFCSTRQQAESVKVGANGDGLKPLTVPTTDPASAAEATATTEKVSTTSQLLEAPPEAEAGDNPAPVLPERDQPEVTDPTAAGQSETTVQTPTGVGSFGYLLLYLVVFL